MRNPAYGTRHGKDHGEHGRRNAHRFQNNARVEIDVRVEFLLDEVRVVQRDVFQLHRHFQQIIFGAQLFQHFVAGLTHNGRARVVVFVNTVTEAHQTEGVILVFRAAHELRNVLNGADLFQHLKCCFVRAAVRRSPQGGDTRSDTGERVRAGRARGTDGRGRGVLFVVSVQDQNTVHRAFQHRVHFILFTRRREHHAQEVTCVGEVVAWIHKRLTDRVFVTHRRHSRHFGQQTERRDITVTWVIHVQRIVVERRQRTGNTAHDRHRMRVTTERMEQTGNLLMDHGVTGHGGFKFIVLGLRRFFAVQQDVAHFQIVGFGG